MTIRMITKGATSLAIVVSIIGVTAVVPPAYALEITQKPEPQLLTQTHYLQSAELQTLELASVLKERVEEPQVATSQRFPVAPAKEPRRVKTFLMTAYSSTPDQTDGDPFTTASGKRVAPGVVASNAFPMGTQFTIPEYSGDTVYTVWDRHSTRLSPRIDIWMPSRHEAMQFGVQRLTIHVL